MSKCVNLDKSERIAIDDKDEYLGKMPVLRKKMSTHTMCMLGEENLLRHHS